MMQCMMYVYLGLSALFGIYAGQSGEFMNHESEYVSVFAMMRL